MTAREKWNEAARRQKEERARVKKAGESAAVAEATAEGWVPYFDAVRRFRVGADTLSRLVQEGRVRSKKVGRSRLFDPASLEEYLVEARAARKAEHGKLLREARARKMEEKIERRKAIHEMIRGLIAEDIEALEEFEALVHAASFVRRVK